MSLTACLCVIFEHLCHIACLSEANKYSQSVSQWLGSRVVSVLDSAAEAPGFKSQPRRCRVTVLGKLFTPIVPLFNKQQNYSSRLKGCGGNRGPGEK